MQTFLPHADFTESARVLDQKRLGKQRVETLQIVQALTGVRRDVVTDELLEFEPRGWRNHPAAVMWRGHVDWLVRYQFATCDVWAARGYRDTCRAKTLRIFSYAIEHGRVALATSPPPWLGDPELHRSHRSNLLRKAPDHYRAYWPDEVDDLAYVWPGLSQLAG